MINRHGFLHDVFKKQIRKVDERLEKKFPKGTFTNSDVLDNLQY